MPRTTSHSVWPSATVPDVDGGGLPAAPSASALASAPAAAIPGQPPSALTSSSGVTALFGDSGGGSIETLRMNKRPGSEKQSATLLIHSGGVEHPASTRPRSSKSRRGF